MISSNMSVCEKKKTRLIISTNCVTKFSNMRGLEIRNEISAHFEWLEEVYM